MLWMRQAIRSVVVGSMLARERWQSGVAYNPLSKRTAQDPYPVYAALRERDPVHRSRLMNAWLFTRHADVDTILRDHQRFGNDPRKGELSRRQRANLHCRSGPPRTPIPSMRRSANVTRCTAAG